MEKIHFRDLQMRKKKKEKEKKKGKKRKEEERRRQERTEIPAVRISGTEGPKPM